MSNYVPAAIRRFVFDRADELCEYCLIHNDHTFFGCEIEHVISRKHGGPTTPENLALACFFCNSFKGSDIASISLTGHLFRLFNPRADRWRDHFILERDIIMPLTEIGDVTAHLLRMNDPDRVDERAILRGQGKHPTAAALRRMF